MFNDTIMHPRFLTILEPVEKSDEKSGEKLRDTKFPDPFPFTISHPLPNIIRKFNDFMYGITVVFAQWAETGELYPLP